MNPELHHRWNAERDPDRGSKKEAEEILKETLQQNKVKIRQSRPR